MEPLNHLSMEELIDRLAHYTQEHIRLMRENIREEEYLNCKKTLKEIAAEIASRRQKLEDESRTDLVI